jgi:alpha/beta superfamily hydrolase
MNKEKVAFYSDSVDPIRLEGILDLPEGADRPPVCILCHPHPIGGGSMYVPLLEIMAEELSRQGWACLRFNFRGVGGSSGETTGGVRETEDVEGAFGWLREREDLNAENLALAGWSFGSWVGLRWAVKSGHCRRIALVNPPLVGFDFFYFLDVDEGKIPDDVLIISGEVDQFADPSRLRELSDRLEAELYVLSGADHFLFGREREVARIVARRWQL